MENLSREYCAYFGEATEVWKRHVIGEIIVAFDEYRDSVCQTLQEVGNSGPSVSTSGGQDVNNQEMFSGVLFGGVLVNAQQQAEQRIINAMNKTLKQPPVLQFSDVSIITNQTVQVNPPGESAISQAGVNSGQNDGDGSLNVSIKSEVESSSENECESDTDEDEVQVKEEPNEEEAITVRSEEQTENANNSIDNRKINDSQNDNSNEGANEQESQAMMIDEEEANLEEDPNGPVIIVVQYSSPPASPSNDEQSIHSPEFNLRFNDENHQINMNENEIARDNDEIGQVNAEDEGDGNNEDDEHVDNMEIEENHLYDHQERDYEGSMIDDENDGEESDQFEDQVNMSGIEDNDEEEENEGDDSLMDDNDDSNDDTTDDDDAEEEQAALNAVGPSTSTGPRSTRQVLKGQIVPERQSKRPIRVKKTEPLSVITKKLKGTVPGCKKVVKRMNALNSHLLSSHKLQKYRCLVRRCYGKVSTSFTTQSRLNDHRDHVHGNTTRWTCKCSKKFDSYNVLLAHYWQYHQLGQFACSKAGCTFKPTSTRVKVHNHLRNHLEANFECLVDGCGKSFKAKSDLDRHLLTHSGERPFSCTECDKSFKRKGNLTRHLRIHRNDKCYRCTWPQCAYSSTNRSQVITHIRTAHFQLPRTKKQQAEESIEDDRDPRVFLAKN